MQSALCFNQNDDDDDVYTARCRTEAEIINHLMLRPDIFAVANDPNIKWMQSGSLLLALITGTALSLCKPPLTVTADLLSNLPEINQSFTIIAPIAMPKKPLKQPPPHQVVRPANTIVSKKDAGTKSAYHGSTTVSGSGDPRARVAHKGVIGLLAQNEGITGKTFGGDPLAQGGFASGIDAIIAGTQGLVKGSSSAPGRRGVSSIGTGDGYGLAGFEGSGTGDDLFAGLVSQSTPLVLKQRAHTQSAIKPADIFGIAKIAGGARSKSTIMRVVLENISSLRYAYNRLLREQPQLHGKITLRFAVDESGTVIFCEIVQSTMNNKAFEQQVRNSVMRWQFDAIDRVGDVTEVVYPFVFAM